MKNHLHSKIVLQLVSILCCIVLFETTTIAQNNLPKLEWANSMGTSYNDNGNFVVDNDKNVIVTSYYSGTIDLNQDTSNQFLVTCPVGKKSFYIAKYDSLGKFDLGINIVGKSYSYYPNALAIDKNNNFYVAGLYQDTTDFDPSPGQAVLTGGVVLQQDLFFAKYDVNGNLIWVKSILVHSKYITEHVGIVIDQFDQLYLIGRSQDSVDFDPGPGIATTIGQPYTAGYFIAKYDLNGNYIWARNLRPDPSFFRVDSQKNIVIGGSFEISTSYNIGNNIVHIDGTAVYYTMGGSNMWDGPNGYVAKLDSMGQFKWFNYFQGTENNEVVSVEIDNQDRILIMGIRGGNGRFISQNDTLNLPFVSNNLSSYFQKLGPNGDFLSVKNFFGRIYTTYVDSAMNYYFPFYVQHIFDFDPGPGFNVIGNISPQEYLVKYDSDLNFVSATKVAMDMFGYYDFKHLPSLFLLVQKSGAFRLDPEFPNLVTLTNQGADDYCFAKYNLDSCSNFYVNIDSIHQISCNTSGEIFTHPTAGSPPYTYSWNSNPSTTASASFTSPSFVQMQVTDSRGCNASVNTRIEGPYQNDMDFSVNNFSDPFRTGLNSRVFLDVSNNGCLSQSGVVYLVKDSILNFVSSNYPLSHQNGDTLFWNVPNINYSSPIFHVEVILSTTAIVPNTPIKLFSRVLPYQNDIDTTNNFSQFFSSLQNSYDPNEKLVEPKGNGPLGKILNNQKMKYTIHFQNTGNAAAINVFLADTLSNALDLSSIKLIGSSHPISNWFLIDHTILFEFNNINLPDSFSDYIGSNGYVIFEIKQKPNLPDGTSIENKAYIYFDYNPAIVTNTVINTIDLLTHEQELKVDENEIILFPNPANKNIAVYFNKSFNHPTIKVLDTWGRILNTPIIESKGVAVLSISDLPNGIYTLVLSDFESGFQESKTFLKME